VEKRLPTLFELNEVSEDNPVVLYHSSGQMCFVNSKAAELAEINRQSTNGIERTQTGEFTGVLRDEATNLVWNIIPQPDEQEMFESSILALQQIAQSGITSINWLPLSFDEIKVIETLNQKNKLPIRINVIAPANLFDKILQTALEQNSKSGMLKFGGFELFADGYLASRTAALFKPYNDCQSVTGKLLCSQENMALTAKKIIAAGFQLVIHAVGDKAVDTALNVIEQVAGENIEKKLRCCVEQAAVLTEKIVERMKKLEVTVSVQPRVITSEFSIWSAIKLLGTERAKLLFPLKTLFDAGILVAGGSDCPMEPLNPMLGIQEAVTREPFMEQRLSVEEALRMYNVNAAYISGEEDTKGSIEVGKIADFTVLSEDPLTAEPNKVACIKVEMSILGGQVIFNK
jgi:predicted amidohydrolase YtcJ